MDDMGRRIVAEDSVALALWICCFTKRLPQSKKSLWRHCTNSEERKSLFVVTVAVRNTRKMNIFRYRCVGESFDYRRAFGIFQK